MRLSWRHIDLSLVHTFTISRSSGSTKPSVVVELAHDGITGLGEAAPSDRYGESVATVSGFLGNVDLQRFENPFQLEEILAYLASFGEGDRSARAAVDMALHDWIGKKLGMPLWKLWGLDRGKTPVTSFTIGIDSPRVIEEKVREAAPYPILKVKVGVPGDRETILTIRRLTDKKIRVDANEGWKSKEEAADAILWLEEQSVELVEQPLPALDLEGTAWLREQVHIPLFADEAARGLSDLSRLQGVFDGINIKLMKCGGLSEAMRMIHAARALGMKVMLGCMVETSVAISAAGQLSPLADHADLDGNLLITNDPYAGIQVCEGKLMLNDSPGLGVSGRVERTA